MKLWIQDTPVKSISLTAAPVMAGFFLQKPAKSSKTRYHLQARERRIKLWDEGNTEGLFCERITIHQRLRSIKEGMTITKISLKFKSLMSQGDINGASIDNMHSGIMLLKK